MEAKRSFSHSFSVFKAYFASGSKHDEYCESRGERIFTSDEDRPHWVAEPGIDRKASAFIAKFYATRVTNSERQFAS